MALEGPDEAVLDRRLPEMTGRSHDQTLPLWECRPPEGNEREPTAWWRRRERFESHRTVALLQSLREFMEQPNAHLVRRVAVHPGMDLDLPVLTFALQPLRDLQRDQFLTLKQQLGGMIWYL